MSNHEYPPEMFATAKQARAQNMRTVAAMKAYVEQLPAAGVDLLGFVRPQSQEESGRLLLLGPGSAEAARALASMSLVPTGSLIAGGMLQIFSGPKFYLFETVGGKNKSVAYVHSRFIRQDALLAADVEQWPCIDLVSTYLSELLLLGGTLSEVHALALIQRVDRLLGLPTVVDPLPPAAKSAVSH